MAGKILKNTLVQKCKFDNIKNKYTLITNNGSLSESDLIIAASGLYSDKVAQNLDIEIDNMQTIPFRGEYYLLKPATESPKLMANLYQEKPLAQQQIPSHLQQLSYMGVTKVS